MTQPDRSSSSTVNYRMILENTSSPCLVLRPDLTVAIAGDAYLKATSLDRDAVLDRPLLEVFPRPGDDPAGETARKLRSSLEQVQRTCQPDTVTIWTQGKQVRSWNLVSSPVLDRSGMIAYIVHRIDDTTDLEQLKRAGREHSRMTRRLALRLQGMQQEMSERTRLLREANQRLRTAASGPRDDLMRQLAGSVAHDFNDLMTVIAGSLSLIEDYPGASADLRQLTAAMQHAIERGSRLTGQLLAVWRDLATHPDSMALKDLLFPTASEPVVSQRARARAPAAAIPAGSARPGSAVGRCGRILVVEDDPDVLTAVLGAVNRLGYGTIAARDAGRARAARSPLHGRRHAERNDRHSTGAPRPRIAAGSARPLDLGLRLRLAERGRRQRLPDLAKTLPARRSGGETARPHRLLTLFTAFAPDALARRRASHRW
jgi:signal transduction histidine kinase